jgi:hypothetical protein
MLWSQRGCCYYSNMPMEIKRPHHDWRMSLDRIDNSSGYTVDNCVLIANEFNTSDHSLNNAVSTVYGTAQWSRSKVSEVDRLRTLAVDLHALAEMVLQARSRPRWKRTSPRTNQSLVHNSSIAVERCCSNCGQSEPVVHFYSSLRRRQCKPCLREKSRKYSNTLRGYCAQLLSGARHRSKLRHHDCTITRDDLLDMLLSQGGRCFYSGMPMECVLPNSHWRMSLERFDNKKGYMRDNCALIASEFNTPDHSHAAVSKVHGTAQWSRSKVEMVWAPTGLQANTKKQKTNQRYSDGSRVLDVMRL